MNGLRIVLGVFLLILSIGLYLDIAENRKLSSEYSKSKAVVVNAQNNPNGNIQDFEVIYNANGEKKQANYNSRTIVRNNTYAIGDTINILYENKSPANIIIEGSLDDEIRNNIFFVGIFSLALLVSFFWKTLKKLLL
jgi:uncharacterized protein YxeA